MSSKVKLERDIEDKYVEKAKLLGVRPLKMQIPGVRNHPDRQIFLWGGYSFFIEFKRPGETPRKGQLHNHKLWRERGFNVYVCDTWQDALEITEWEIMVHI